jgi:long-chain acyl-CoA synthetase
MNYVSYVRLRAATHPETIAVRSGPETWSYGELFADVQRAANALADAGVDRGDTCALLLSNRYEFVVGTLATLARRALVTPINPKYRNRELGHILAQSAPTAAIGCADAYEQAVDHLPEETTWFDTDGVTGNNRRSFSTALADADDGYRLPETLDEEQGFLLYTSGTTGTPKGAVHTHGTFTAVADACTICYEMLLGNSFLSVMPFYHCTGMSILGTTLKVGGELVLMDEWDAEASLSAIEEYDVETFSGVPTMFQDWLAVDGDYDTSSLKVAQIGGSGTSTELIERSEALLGCPVINGFGMTETFVAGVWEDLQDDRLGDRRPPSVGRATDRLVEVKIVDPDTSTEQSPNEPGELLLRGQTVMEEYYKEPALTTDAFMKVPSSEASAATDAQSRWLKTGDWAQIDEDGFLYILDRMDDTIICGGHNVYPQEVQDTIEELNGVEQAVVVGREDKRKGEKPVALVSRHDVSVTADTIKSWCLDQLAAYKHPREVRFVEEFPRNGVGKVDRDALANHV